MTSVPGRDLGRPAPARRGAFVRCGIIAVSVVAILSLFSDGASAAPAPSAWWHLTTRAVPANIKPGGEATILNTAINVGDHLTSGELKLTYQLPEHVVAKEAKLFSTSFVGGSAFDLNEIFGLCELVPANVVCTIPAAALEEEEGALKPIFPFGFLEMRVTVEAQAGAGSGGPEILTMSGGGARPRTIRRPLVISEAPVLFGVEEFNLSPEAEGGATATRAGSHPFQLTNTVSFKREDPSPLKPPALPRDLRFKLPPGLLGNATVAPKCSVLQFGTFLPGGGANACPAASAIGASLVTVAVGAEEITKAAPVFNLAPAPGEPARFGFEVEKVPVVLDTALRSGNGEDYGVTVSSDNITQLAGLAAVTTTFWGAPAEALHDESRGWGCIEGGFPRRIAEEAGYFGLSCTSSPSENAPAFLTLPTNCSAAFDPLLEASSWPTQAAPDGLMLNPLDSPLADEAGNPATISLCNQLPFAPALRTETTASTASSPSGLSLDLNFDDEGIEAGEVAESQLKKVTMALPEGVITNPAVANGLTACSLAQYRAENLADAAGCPESSKIGEVEIESPLVEPIIHGSIYVAAEHDNPANNLLSIYIVAKNPELGVLVRSAGAVSPNQQTGQLTTTFDELPQLPFSHLHLSFRSGQRAPLITPGLCGRYAAQADLYPYSDPNVPLHREASFEVIAGANGAPCATNETQLPNKPSLEAGTATPIAGAYSPLVFRVHRADGSQTLSQVSATLPEGLLGKLAGVEECTDAQIKTAESRSGEGQGALELDSPSCPPASRVGTVSVGTGVGTQPYYVQGKAYLAGPYKGAPLSLAIITPAVVGPFDLGTIVVRTALYVNETTAQITAKSDPIPIIVHGLPTVVQSISLNMNRPNFTINPTSCEPKQIDGSATSTLGSVAPLQQRFQVGACGALDFNPSLKLSLKGSTKRSGVPALKAVLTDPKGNYSNIKSISTVLPKSEFIDQAHIGNTCTRVQFNAGAGHGAECPKRSVLGHATAFSPLLDNPLKGTVYLRSNGGERELPDIVAALKGQIPVTLVGFVDSVRKNKHTEISRLRTRFMNVPDAPVSRFVLQLAGAKHGLLQNSANLCKVKNIAQVKATAQNGKTYDTTPKVSNDCGKKGKKKKAGKSKGAH